MEVFIAGATGVLGRRLVQQFLSAGHGVTGLARREENVRLIERLGAKALQADIFNSSSLARAAAGAEAVIHAATAIPTKARTSPSDWEMNDRLRRDGTCALAEAASRVGALIYLQQSIVWVARPPDGATFDETSPVWPHPIYDSAADGENIALEAGARHNFRSAVLRCGAFYSADSAHTRYLAAGLARRRLPIIGRGDAVWATIHADDAAAAFLKAAEAGPTGTWHVVDDCLVTTAELLKEMADRLGAPSPRNFPKWLARLVAGKEAVEFMTVSTRTTNERIKRDLGWSPRYPTYREGLSHVFAEWKKEGFPA